MTTYHGAHEYSTFSASTIPSKKSNNDYSNKFMKILCFPCRLSSHVLHPFGPFRCIWDLFVMLLLIYTLIEIPFTISFGLKRTIRNIGLFVDILLFVDIVLNFNTAYFDKWDNLRLVTNRKFIYKKYLRTWFLIDFVTCIPFEFINYNSNAITNSNQNVLLYIKILRICRLLRIVKIFRFLKMVRIYNGFMKQFVVREVLIAMKLIKMICGMLIFAHFSACLWWYVGTHTEPSWVDKWELRTDKHSSFTKYTFSWYWAVVTLFTTGYGDIVPINVTEKWISSVCILIGTCFFAYFVGTLTVLITEGDRIKSYERDKLEEAQSFCERKKLPKELTHAILTHIRYHFSYNYVFDESDVLSILPSYLQHDIHTYVSKQFLLQLKIFQNDYINLPEFIIGLIALKTRSISCNQSYKLFEVDDMAKEFYIQRTGKSLLCDKNDRLIHELSRGSVCGEYASFLFKRHRTKVECLTWCEYYAISIDDIKQILDTYYPKSSHLKWERMKKYLKHAYTKDIQHYVQFTQTEQEEIYNPSASLRDSDINNVIKQHSKSPHRNDMPPYDESIHLFQLKKHKNETSEKQTTLRSSLGPSHAIPPIVESDNDDKEELQLEEKHNVQHKIKRTKTYNNYNKFAKFKVRSNSALRNALVVAHGEKHNKTEPTAPLRPKLQKSKTEPNIIAQKRPPDITNMRSALELGVIKTNVLKNSASARSAISPMESPNSPFYNENENDSECSLSSLTDFSTDDDMKDFVQTNKTMSMVKKKMNTKPKSDKIKKRKKFKNAKIARGKRKSLNLSPKIYNPNIKMMSSLATDDHERLKPCANVNVSVMNKTSSNDSVFAAMSQTSGHSSGHHDVITTADNTEDEEESNNISRTSLHVSNSGSQIEVEKAHLFMSTLASNREHLYDGHQSENVEEQTGKVT